MPDTLQDQDERDSDLPRGSDRGRNADTQQAKLKAVQDVISKYVNQMLLGCGNAECRQALCDDGRKNTAGPPIRRYTPRSARTIALTLASGPKPRSRLCAEQEIPSNGPRGNVDEAPRDHSSVIQLLADTKRIKQLSDPTLELGSDGERNSASAVGPMRRAYQLLDSAEQLCQSLYRQQETAELLPQIAIPICSVIRILLETFPLAPDNTQPDVLQLSIVDATIQFGDTYPQATTTQTRGPEFELWMGYLENMEDHRNSRIFRRCLSCIAQLVERNDDDATVSGGQPARSNAELVCEMIAFWFHHHGLPRWTYALGMWLKKAFLRHWDGEILLREGTVAMASLTLLNALTEPVAEKVPVELVRRMLVYPMRAILNQVTDVSMAQAWLDASSRDSKRPTHLLDFKYLFTNEKRVVYFRTVNHLQMQQAHIHASKVFALRHRATRSTHDVEVDSRITFLEDHYLLLNIGRNNVIRDSFNQIWQRRSSELLRPLRVRLGEMDAFEVGHDLGGVQIEFFNLLCREAFSEELGMFSTDSSTGLSYFRPGSLQPSYMFELFGLLFALAVYNGITLPVSFPLPFYVRLLGLPCDRLDYLRDGWPAMYKSLSDIVHEDIPGLDYAFGLEGNGVRLSISSFEEDWTGKEYEITACIVEATPIVHHTDLASRQDQASEHPHAPASSKIDPSTLDWPGWSFESASSDEPAEITSSNKNAYIPHCMDWLMHISVASQWYHFLTGFDRILPQPQLRMFSPAQLQSLVEGTNHISIPDLRAATEYEGYKPHGTYINTFWTIVEAWPEEKQKQLLKFVTAAERVPVGGAKHVTFKIARVSHPGAEESLPTSSTCFGTLLLPRYESGEVLERKLTVALEMGGEGFGQA